MKSAAALLLACLWAAASHGQGLATGTAAAHQRSSATVTLGATRSPTGPRVLHVDAFEQRHTLRLHPADAPFADTFRMQTTARDGEGRLIFRDVSTDEDSIAGELYQDPESGSVVRVRGASVEGIISPTLTLTAGADGQHEAVRQEILPDHHVSDYLEIPLEERRHFDDSASTRTVSNATLEMLVIVDSALAATLGTDEQVKGYLAVFWNAVNLRFSTVTDPKIQMLLAGAVIIRDAADEPFITNNILENGRLQVAATLKPFGVWLLEQNASLPAYDVGYLMTGQKLNDYGGIAWLGGACKVTSTFMLKSGMGGANSNFGGVKTATHEVAHTLGCPHDGSGSAEACPPAQHFFMSGSENHVNYFLWSPCSEAAMKKYISSNSASCLQTISTGPEIPLSSTLPGEGEHLSLDQQCQSYTGKSGAHVSTSIPEDFHCIDLQCQFWERDRDIMKIVTRQTGRPAAEGSPCPSGGVCKLGSCQ